jgi:hypothetical protein
LAKRRLRLASLATKPQAARRIVRECRGVCGLARPVLNSEGKMLRSCTALVAAVAAGVLVLFTAVPALAQGLTGVTNTNRTCSVPNCNPQDIDDRINWINRKDCSNDVLFTFTLATGGSSFATSAILHVWAAKAGANCQESAQRDDGSCKQVFEGRVYTGTGTQTVRAEVKARDIVRPTWDALTTQQDETVCDTGTDETTIILQFFVLDTSGSVVGTGTTFDASYDLIGPGPPSSVRAGIGEDALVVSWDESSSTEALGTYNVYADEAGTAPPPADAGAGTGGEGGSTSIPADGCISDDLVPGQVPTVGRNTQTNASTTKANAHGLENGVLYAVGVSGVDKFNNPGPLSNIDCATPEPITGFFEAYRDAGGQGGGGYCSLGAKASPLSAAFVALGALAFGVRRRARTKTARPS